MNEAILRLIEQGGYWGIFALMVIENVFPPIPSEVIMSIAGVQAGQGKLSLGWVIAAGTTGAMLGNILWYLAARALGICFGDNVESNSPFLATTQEKAQPEEPTLDDCTTLLEEALAL